MATKNKMTKGMLMTKLGLVRAEVSTLEQEMERNEVNTPWVLSRLEYLQNTIYEVYDELKDLKG